MPEDDYPRWYEGKTLKALDFIAFEKYLFSRFKYPGRGFGIVGFDIANDLLINKSTRPGFLSVQIRGLTGITSAGHLVELGRVPLTTAIEVHEDKLNVFDLEVVVDNQDDEVIAIHPIEGNQPNKYQLKGYLCDDGAIRYKRRENALYLGRYAFKVEYQDGQASTKMKLLQYPAVYTFSSIKFFNLDEWTKWTQPISDRLEAIIKRLQSKKLALFSHAQSVALSEAYWLAYHWSSLPVPHLKEQLQYLHWLLEVANNKRAVDAKGVMQLDGSKIDIDIDVNTLPQRLAGLIGNQTATVDGGVSNLVRGTSYDIEWDFSNLILTFRGKYPPSIFQTMLYFGEGEVHDCIEKVEVEVRDTVGRRKLSPEVIWIPPRDHVKNKVVYIIQVGKPLEEGDTMVLYNVSSKDPRPKEIIRRKSIG